MKFKKYSNFHKHVYRNHSVYKKVKDNLLYCNYKHCYFKHSKRNIFMNHMFVHIKKEQYIYCPFTECANNKKLFKTKPSFSAHVYRCHNVSNTSVPHTSDLEDYKSETVLSEIQPEQLSNIFENNTSDQLESIYIKSLAMNYLLLQCKNFLPDNALQYLIEAFLNCHDISKSILHSSCKNTVPEHLLHRILEADMFYKTHNKNTGIFRSVYSRKQFYKKNFDYVQPMLINLGRNNEHKKCFYYYIPILETLKVLLKNENVFQFCADDSGVYSHGIHNYSLCSKDQFFQHKNNLKIILYQDVFEICNPLGSSKGKHKMLGVYMSLANLPHYYRTKTDQIQLVLLCNENNLKYFGYNKIFDKVLCDVKILEARGIEINKYLFYGSIFCVLGDNLGSHQIGGFVENFVTSEYFCRYCYVTRQELNGEVSQIQNIRTPDTYNDDIKILKETDLNHFRGIKTESCLNSLKYFHVCKPGLPPCVAHDIYEGVLQNDLILLIDNLVSKEWFTYQYLNYKLQNLKFSFENDYKKPIILKKKEKTLWNRI